MSQVDKNKAVIEFLVQCPSIASNPLFFNFGTVKTDNKQLVTVTNDINIHRPYIDGSVMKRYTFTIYDYKSISYNAIVKTGDYPDENVEDMLQSQGIIDWITEQAEMGNYPNFGDDIVIDRMVALSDNPALSGVDTSLQPTLARYSISIQIDYIDYTKSIWR